MLLHKARQSWILFLFVVAGSGVLRAQQSSRNNDFQSAQLDNYRSWLIYAKLDNILSAESIEKVNDVYVLNMNIRDTYNWDLLISHSDSAFKIYLPEILFDKFIFQMDLLPVNGKIRVEAKDAAIMIESKGAELSVEKWKKMGEPSGHDAIPFAGLIDIGNMKTATSKKPLDDVKNLIQSGLKNYLVKYKAKMEDFRFEVLYQLDNNLILEVSNIVNAVLDEGYFEHLRFLFNFKQEDGLIKVTYQVLGKYGAGIIWAPKDSRYHDMIPKYEQAFKRFSLVISNQIGQYIK